MGDEKIGIPRLEHDDLHGGVCLEVGHERSQFDDRCGNKHVDRRVAEADSPPAWISAVDLELVESFLKTCHYVFPFCRAKLWSATYGFLLAGQAAGGYPSGPNPRSGKGWRVSSLCDLRLRCYLATQEISNCTRDFLVVGLQREVARIVKMHLGAGIVALECFRTRGQKKWVTLAPDGQHGRQTCAEIFLELRVERDIAGVIQKQVKLDLIISGSRQKRRIEFVRFGRHQRRVLDAMQVLPFGRLGREELAESSAILRCRFFPILLDRIPALAQALLIGIAVLRNDGGDPLRMR